MSKSNLHWKSYVRPGRIFGNLYFVGTYAASSHIIDTGEGLIMIDTGYAEGAYLVLHNIWDLGFCPYDIKYIIHSHGHYDHVGATRALAELTGAKTAISRIDAPMVDGTLVGEGTDIAKGSVDMTLARELGYEFKDFFTPDILLDDGDVLTLGNTSIRCVATPGHTDGTMSFFFDVTDGTNTYRVGTHGGSGTNTQTDDFIRRYGITTQCRRDYMASLDRLEQEHVDIHMGNHVWNNDTDKKLKILNDDPDGPNPFIDPEAWGKFLAVRRAAGEKIMAETKME